MTKKALEKQLEQEITQNGYALDSTKLPPTKVGGLAHECASD